MSEKMLRESVKLLDGAPQIIRHGCNRWLEKGQWWGYCGETDMGQTLPALCTECGGPFVLAPDKKGETE